MTGVIARVGTMCTLGSGRRIEDKLRRRHGGGCRDNMAENSNGGRVAGGTGGGMRTHGDYCWVLLIVICYC